MTKAKIAVFCDGDYWHGHNWAVRGLPSLEAELDRYSEYWRAKIRNNIARDEMVTQRLRTMGWQVIRVWESDIKKDLSTVADAVEYSYRRKAMNYE